MGLNPITTDPFNGEASLRALAAETTPIEDFYVRNNFPVPSLDAATWRLRIHGRVDRECSLTLEDLQALPRVTRRVTFECAGNGRRLMTPPAPGTQWMLGAAGTATFSGTPLRDVLRLAGIADGAAECVFTGADGGTVPDRGEIRFQRSLPVTEALAATPLVAWEMNGRPLTPDHGHPVRLVVPEHYAVASVKWLVDIEAVDRPFDGHFQTDRYVYREPGEADRPVSRMRVRSLIVSLGEGDTVEAGDVEVHGVAWSGYGPVERVEVSVDGDVWRSADFEPAQEAGVATHWRCRLDLPPGPHSIRARATDSTGVSQPLVSVWNELGYGNNVVHEVRIECRR